MDYDDWKFIGYVLGLLVILLASLALYHTPSFDQRDFRFFVGNLFGSFLFLGFAIIFSSKEEEKGFQFFVIVVLTFAIAMVLLQNTLQFF